MWIPKAGTNEYAAHRRAWVRRFPGRPMRDVEPADEYRVVKFAGGEIGGADRYLVDYHVIDSRGRTVSVYPRRENTSALKMARSFAHRMNVHLARARMLA